MPSPIENRQRALDCYQNCKYAEAEKLLRPFIAEGYELAGTHCHLARVLLMMDREPEARQEVAQAWEHRNNSPSYVIPRILFFQVLFALLDEAKTAAAAPPAVSPSAAKPPRPASADLLERLRDELVEKKSYAEWTLRPLLHHVRPRLNEEDFELICALAVEINGPGCGVPF
ncbi:MAG: hypothetical protein NT105_23360 [Verrucomicrobia bacterium]|nr:hypothetical protein [Verrucomicrobiota bacterium]